MSNVMELHVLKGIRGLSSCDVRSLYVLAYCRLSKIADISVKETSSYKRLLDESYPCLHVPSENGEEQNYKGASEIIDYLREHGNGIDAWLTAAQSAEACALEFYIVGALAPAVEHILWVDESSWKTMQVILNDNFLAGTFFSSVILPYIRRQRRARLHRVTKKKLMNAADVKASIFLKAKECLSNLSGRLSSDSFFCGNQACYIDALILSYLLFFKQIPSMDRSLANYIAQCPNLDSFAKRLSLSLFKIDLTASANQPSNSALTVSTTQVTEFPNAVRNSVIASGVAIGAIVLYMLSTGMLALEFSDEEDQPTKPGAKKQSEDSE